ncbi:MAG: transaldolase [Gammaproteobacteria bacterium]|nr:transaldolase [Gammaproteobacteria bacterium]
MNPLLRLKTYGQSIWLDNIHRNLLESGELERMIREDGICGITSNPTIFEQAINGSPDYDHALQALVMQNPGQSPQELFYTLAVEDIQAAADILLPVYESSGHRDGMVSLEVSPELAHDTAGTIAEARALHKRVNRPNLMIKVPATREGLPAIQQLISEGINVNVTLLFAVDRYRAVAEAYLAGLEARRDNGYRHNDVASVASFFISRVDNQVDKLLEQKAAAAPEGERAAILALRGKAAIANAKLAYQVYREMFGSGRFRALAHAGAHVQRLLWGSTGTKNPDYSDVLYIEELIGPETVNTVPPGTYLAYRDHGDPHVTLSLGVSEARDVLQRIAELGIDLAEITRELEVDGVKKFAQSFHTLLDVIANKAAVMSPTRASGGTRRG